MVCLAWTFCDVDKIPTNTLMSYASALLAFMQSAAWVLKGDLERPVFTIAMFVTLVQEDSRITSMSRHPASAEERSNIAILLVLLRLGPTMSPITC